MQTSSPLRKIYLKVEQFIYPTNRKILYGGTQLWFNCAVRASGAMNV